MKPLLRSILTLSTAGAVLAACADNRSPEPTAPSRLQPSFVLGALTSVCDVNAIKADARAYFAKNNDPAFKTIADLSKATGSAATELVFDAVSRVAVARGTALQNSTVTGEIFDHLVKGLFGCAESYIRTGVGDVDFAPLLPPGHLFAVRGKNVPEEAGGAYQNGTTNPFWGVEPPGGSWPSTLASLASKRLLIYEGPVPSGFLNTSGVIGSTTDIRTIPVLSSGQVTVNVGLCNIPFGDETFPGSRRLNHNNFYQPYLALACSRPEPQTASAVRAPFDPRVLARRAFDFFAPRELNAAVMFGGLGVVGSGLSDLSPVGVYDLSQIALGSLGTIQDGTNSMPLKVAPSVPVYDTAVVVRATSTADNAPLAGIPIEMSIQGNSSTIAFFAVGGVPALTVTRLTDASGYANFGDVSLTKAGGYTLTFQVHFTDAAGDVVGLPLASNSFNIQNK